MTSTGKDEIEGAWGGNVAGCPDNVEGRSGVDEDSWAWKNGDAVQPVAEKTGGNDRECWPNGRVSEVEGWGFTTEREDCWLNEDKGCRSCCTDSGITFDNKDAQVVAGGLWLDKDDLDDVGDVDTEDVKVNDVNTDNVKIDDANVDDVDADDVDVDDVDADDVDADEVDTDDVDADDVDAANIDVDDVGVDNVDDVEVDNDTVHVGCPVLLASIIEIKTDDQYKIWRAAFSAEPQAVPSGVSGEAWNVCSWEDTSLKELINGNGWSDEGPSFLVSVMAVIPTTAS